MKKIVCNIILSIVTFVALLIYNNDFLNGNSYDIFITLLFFAIYYFDSKFNTKCNKKAKNANYDISMVCSNNSR